MNILIISGVLVAALIVFGLGWFLSKGASDKKHLAELANKDKDHKVALGREEDKRGEVETRLEQALKENEEAGKTHSAQLSEIKEEHEKAMADAVAKATREHLEILDKKVGELKAAHRLEVQQAVDETAEESQAKGYSEGRAEALGNPVPFAELRKGTYLIERSITVGHASYGLGITQDGNPILINLAGAQGDVPMRIDVGQDVVCSSVPDQDVFLVMVPESLIPKPAAPTAPSSTETKAPEGTGAPGSQS